MALSFDADIKGLFREKDRTAMLQAFDLWKYEDVKEHADAIYDSVESGSMPCDGDWNKEQLSTLKAWIDEGMPA